MVAAVSPTKRTLLVARRTQKGLVRITCQLTAHRQINRTARISVCTANPTKRIGSSSSQPSPRLTRPASRDYQLSARRSFVAARRHVPPSVQHPLVSRGLLLHHV